MLVKRTKEEELEQCPKCDYEYKPRKNRSWKRCPKCKHVYENEE